MTDFDALAANVTTSDNGAIPDHTKGDEKPSPAETLRKKFTAKREDVKRTPVKKDPPRKLLKSDKEKIENVYATLALVFSAPTPLQNIDACDALAGCSGDCAEAWMRVAENNDAVRRVLLMFIEGGAYGALIAAHIPIILAFMPEQTKRMMGGMFPPPNIPDTPEGI